MRSYPTIPWTESVVQIVQANVTSDLWDAFNMLKNEKKQREKAKGAMHTITGKEGMVS